MEFNGENESSLSRVNDVVTGKDRRVGLIFDERMCKHYTPDEEDHPECPDRIRVIWDRLNSSGLAKRCIVLNAKDAKDTHLALVHTKSHIDLIKNISSQNSKSKRKRIASNFNSIYFNEGSSEAAYLAAGSVIEAVEKVAKGELDSAFAIVRPPGHHAEEDEPMGFCLYNNVGIATSFLLNERSELGIKKILIVDWDVHHGNGTQKMFYNDHRVLFFSVHRFDGGTFYPSGHDGSYIMTGEEPGAGYNINVPWDNGRCGDADYLAVWDHILIPVAKEFNPDMVIISAGFDAAIGDPLGGCRVSPYGYSVMLDKLMEFAGGKIVMALEGGYNLNSIANSAKACVEVLLQDKPAIGLLEAYPFASTWRVIQEVRQQLSTYWPVFAAKLPDKVISKTSQFEILSSDSDVEDENIPATVSEAQPIEDVIQPLMNLKVNEDSRDQQAIKVSLSWRSELSKVDIWYATFGSNMSISRFRCYIEGGQTEGMKRPCVGSMDKNMPKENLWKTFPHRLFFARDRTDTWGPGGVAFLHPSCNTLEKTHMCLYRITLEQFNDVLLQENISDYDMSHPLFDLTALKTIQTEKYISVEPVQRGWYHNVIYLGKEKDIPILTMTCSLSDIDSFISGKFPISPPCKEYANTLIKGLVEGRQLSEEEASAYIHEASMPAFNKQITVVTDSDEELDNDQQMTEADQIEEVVDPSAHDDSRMTDLQGQDGHNAGLSIFPERLAPDQTERLSKRARLNVELDGCSDVAGVLRSLADAVEASSAQCLSKTNTIIARAEEEKAELNARLESSLVATERTETDMEKWKVEVERAQAEANQATGDLTSFLEEKAALEGSQGKLLHSFLDRLLTTTSFSRFIMRCAQPLITQAKDDLMKQIQVDHPEVPILKEEKYGYSGQTTTQRDVRYMKIILKRPPFPLLDRLANRVDDHQVLTPQGVLSEDIDQDKDFIPLMKKLKETKATAAAKKKGTGCESPAPGRVFL